MSMLIKILSFILVVSNCFAQHSHGHLSTQEEWYLVQCSTKPAGQYIGRQDSVLKALDSYNIYNSLDRLWHFSQDVAANALIPLNNPGVINTTWPTTSQNINSVGFTAGKGYKGDGTSSYIKSNYFEDVSPVNFTQNNGSLGVMVIETNSGAYGDFGDATTAGSSTIYASYSGTLYGSVYNTSSATNAGAIASPYGFSYCYRTSSTHPIVGKNGVDITTGTNTSSATVGHYSLGICAITASGAPLYYSPRTIACAYIAAGTVNQGTIYNILVNLR